MKSLEILKLFVAGDIKAEQSGIFSWTYDYLSHEQVKNTREICDLMFGKHSKFIKGEDAAIADNTQVFYAFVNTEDAKYIVKKVGNPDIILDERDVDDNENVILLYQLE